MMLCCFILQALFLISTENNSKYLQQADIAFGSVFTRYLWWQAMSIALIGYGNQTKRINSKKEHERQTGLAKNESEDLPHFSLVGFCSFDDTCQLFHIAIPYDC